MLLITGLVTVNAKTVCLFVCKVYSQPMEEEA